MIRFEDECVGCPTEMGCLGNSCKYNKVPHFYCDECGDEVDEGDLYEFDGQQLCIDCIEERLPKARWEDIGG